MSEPAIVFEELHKEFRSRRRAPLVAIERLDLEIAPGQVFGLLGPNGSGKTTSVNLLCGLLRPTSGTVRVQGIDVRTDLAAARARLGVVPQETALYDDLTAQENLAFHARLYGVPATEQARRIDEVLELVGLTQRRRDRVGTYSGGMQRRLALARALLTAPPVVVLDEPTLGVDVQSRNALWERIRTIADTGGTVLLTTNYMEEAQALADRLAILDHGRLVTTGEPDTLRAGLGRTFVELATRLLQPERARLAAVPGVTACTWTGDAVTVTTDGDPGSLRAVLEWFERADPHARLIGVRQPDLNDVFLALTGTALRDAGSR